MRLDRYKIHDIELVVDRLKVDKANIERLQKSVQSALAQGGKSLMVFNYANLQIQHYSRLLMCPTSGISYPEPEPNLFSFNSPYGACSTCNGLGVVSEVDREKVIPNPKLSIKQGGFAPLGKYKKSWIFDKIEGFLELEGWSLSTPLEKLPDETLQSLLHGREAIRLKNGKNSPSFEGIIEFLTRHFEDDTSAATKRWIQQFMNTKTCPDCNGSRLKKRRFILK